VEVRKQTMCLVALMSRIQRVLSNRIRWNTWQWGLSTPYLVGNGLRLITLFKMARSCWHCAGVKRILLMEGLLFTKETWWARASLFKAKTRWKLVEVITTINSMVLTATMDALRMILLRRAGSVVLLWGKAILGN